MRKKMKIMAGAVIVIAAGYLGLVAYASQYDQSTDNPNLAPAGKATGLNASAIKILNQSGCYYCHSNSAKLPAYAKLPVSKQLMDYDVRTGNRSFDITPTLTSLANGTPVPEVDLAKIENVINSGSMPPTRYTAVHWSGSLNNQDKSILQDWIKAQRHQYYASTNISQEHKGGALQPLPDSLPVQLDKVTLGNKLFHDRRLSSDSSVSCASCHDLGANGVDRRITSLGVDGQHGPVNAPTVFNAVFNHAQFWDGRAANLQEQAGGPPLNPIEMASTSWEQIIDKLKQDPILTAEFLKVYPDGYSGHNITDAIAEFEKTLITPNSAFDRYLKGEANALTEQQKRGLALFNSNKCATCHTGRNLGGQSYEIMGLKKDYFSERDGPLGEADHGRYNVTKNERDKYRFKTPTLRNVAQTAPYMHDGRTAELRDAVKLMLKYQVGTTLPENDVDDMVAFLESLNGVYQPQQK